MEKKKTDNPFTLTATNFQEKDHVLDNSSTKIINSPNKYQMGSTQDGPIYKIDDAKPPYNDQQLCAPLPPAVEFNRINQNVMNALNFLREDKFSQNANSKNQSRFEKWQGFLKLEENLLIVSDCFWYAICKFFHTGKYKEIEQKLKDRIAKNYVNFFLTIEDPFEKDQFFKRYFDILSQSTFYSLFYAFPKSRYRFNEDLIHKLLKKFSKKFTGVKISNTDHYIQKWCLDLGAGNIFKNQQNQKLFQKVNTTLPDIDINQKQSNSVKNKRTTMPMRYSPMVQKYLENNKYKTINYLRGFKMKFTEYDDNQKQINEKFEKYKKIAQQITANSEALKKLNEKEREQMDNEIKAIKKDTLRHQRRLEKRKAEELERGAHEYANYLVSMLNSGITLQNIQDK